MPTKRGRTKPADFSPLGRPLRVLWCSDAPWATSGYSQITRQQAPALRSLGVEIALLATFGLHGAVREWNGLRVYPGGADPFANDAIPHAARDWRADVVITLKDVPVFTPQTFQGLRWVPMVPVDHEPLPPAVVERARACYRPIAYAPNGFRDLRAAGLDPLYAPHSYDPAVFYPVDKAEARAALGWPADRFVVGTVAVNRGGIPSRKAWPQNIEGYALFEREHPDAMYALHTDLAQDGYEGGLQLQYYLGRYGVRSVWYCNQDVYRKQGFPEAYLRAFYAGCDVLLATSAGEGFGIPQLEAQACGTPVITSGWCASEDLCFAGWTVGRDEAFRFPDNQGSDVFLPFPAAVAGALDQAYQATRDPRTASGLRDTAIGGAAAHALPTVVERYWRPLVEELARDIAGEGTRGVLRIVRPEEMGIEGRAA